MHSNKLSTLTEEKRKYIDREAERLVKKVVAGKEIDISKIHRQKQRHKSGKSREYKALVYKVELELFYQLDKKDGNRLFAEHDSYNFREEVRYRVIQPAITRVYQIPEEPYLPHRTNGLNKVFRRIFRNRSRYPKWNCDDDSEK
ncbi:hypothetical protein BN7_6000 [Wickerhamomyces ciferrii]|uniref:Uncharacterized protein n=1 Tax=Wickerhamomyces ciferrii (strain ATCC 14091 / BCRC 22168 / CBS 111 / JCM 3599 / NBRC 0793 / NRRL Y-1031 F-60-10) TaxID=1206466 RepID=K0KWL6_WICCF|nr:uncharacterized protein BN7_6000 [Wickerhamomyces ciferrii]CCH46407.1 hypothetical protein BN7_6000 [Wickerhamomyces ciferrii]